MTSSGQEKRKDIEQYEHLGKTRVNNPPVGLVTPETDPDRGQKKTYAYDPHLDPQLMWSGKAEHTSFEVPTVSLHVHERIDPRTIIEAVRKRNGESPRQLSLFESERQEPLRQAIEFYKHSHGWSNRLIAGDSLLVMNSLLEKEGMAGQVQMIYIDPPYGIKYGSNFQPFVNKRDVRDGKDEDLTAEPEQIKAFRDTWELGIHSYLTYLRDRLLLARELLSETGSIFVQIGDENVHLVRCLMDEVFGNENFVSLISYRTSIGLGSALLDNVNNYLLWYRRKRGQDVTYRPLFKQLMPGVEGATRYSYVELSDGMQRLLTDEERGDLGSLPSESRLFTDQGLTSRTGSATTIVPFEHMGTKHIPTAGGWRTNLVGLARLAQTNRILTAGKTLRFKKCFQDFGWISLTNQWDDVGGGVQSRADPKVYAVQTTTSVVQRCVLMTTDPGDLVLDPTCVRKGTRVWRVSGPPVVPPHAGGQGSITSRETLTRGVRSAAARGGQENSLPASGEGWGGAGLPANDEHRGAAASLTNDHTWGGAELAPIESIQPGDWVLAHDGLPHRVVRAIRRPYRGRIVGIRHARSDATL